MAFKDKDFVNAEFKPRTEKVPVPDLADWFDEGDKAVWTIRGLTGTEIARAEEIAEKRNLSTAILEGILTLRADEVKEAITKLVGQGDEIPAEMAKKIEHVRLGSVDPVCSEDLAVKLSRVSPTVFYTLAQKIWVLSAQGMSPGKSKPFGKAKKSKQV